MNTALQTYSTTMPTLGYSKSNLGKLSISVSKDDKIPVVTTHHESAISTKDSILNFFISTPDVDQYYYVYEPNNLYTIDRIYKWSLMRNRLENNIRLNLNLSQLRYELLYQEVFSQIDELLTKEYDWDDIGYEKPHPKDIDYAKRIMSDFISSISSKGYSLNSLELPFISNGENGGATIEWRENGRSLYFDIKYQDAEFTKVWQESKKTIVRTDNLCENDYVSVWEWILNE